MSLNTNKNAESKGGGDYQMPRGLKKGGGGLGKCWQWMTKGGGGVGEMLTMADQGGKGVWTPPFWADIVCEQPFTDHSKYV